MFSFARFAPRSTRQETANSSIPSAASDTPFVKRTACEEADHRIPPVWMVFPGLRLRPRFIQRGGLVCNARERVPRNRRRAAGPCARRREVHGAADLLVVRGRDPG